MRMRLLPLGLVAVVLAMPLVGAAASYVVGAAEVQSALVNDPRVVVVDVRTAEEYAQAHIPRAINIPASEMMSSGAKLPRDRATPLIFYCRGAG
jgi:phage shock protein E